MTLNAKQNTAPGDLPAQTRLIDLVFPGDTNHHGTLFGGAGFALMDRIAFMDASPSSPPRATESISVHRRASGSWSSWWRGRCAPAAGP